MSTAVTAHKSNASCLLYLLLNENHLAAISDKSYEDCEIVVNFVVDDTSKFGFLIRSITLKTTTLTGKTCRILTWILITSIHRHFVFQLKYFNFLFLVLGQRSSNIDIYVAHNPDTPKNAALISILLSNTYLADRLSDNYEQVTITVEFKAQFNVVTGITLCMMTQRPMLTATESQAMAVTLPSSLTPTNPPTTPSRRKDLIANVLAPSGVFARLHLDH